MQAILAALVPIFLMIALGFVLRKVRLIEGETAAGLDRINYYVLFPALIVKSLNSGPLSLAEIGELGAIFLLVLASGAGLLALIRWTVPVPGPAFASLVQGILRWNATVGVGALAALQGEAGLRLAGVAFLIVVPIANALSVMAHAAFASEAPRKAPAIALDIVRNPLILASLAGILLNWLGIGLPGAGGAVIGSLAAAAIPLGLLTVGAALDLSIFRASPRLILGISALKLLAMPALAALWARIFGADELTSAVAIIIYSTPTATASYTLARMMGGDASLMAGLIAAMTAGAALTMPIMIFLLS